MTIIFTNRALSHLIKSIDTSGTKIEIGEQDYSQFFESGSDGELYAILRGPTAREIIKIDLDQSIYGSYLSITRGQGGTIAATWPMGTKLFESAHADHYNAIIQAGAARVIDYNPNETLMPLYAGEKVYQSKVGAERWWKAYNAINQYWDLITGQPISGEDYKDIGWDYDLLIPAGASWKQYLDNTYWNAPDDGTWNVDRWNSLDLGGGEHGIDLETIGTWYQGFRPTKMRITFTPWTTLEMELSNNVDAQTVLGDYTSGQEQTVTFTASGDFLYLYFDSFDGPFSITNIEFFG